VQTFATARDAKEFLINQIVAEAELEGVSLSEVERKMLYFSETAWTLPDIKQVNKAFDRDYDQTEYELKIAKLVRSARARALDEDRKEYRGWSEAIRMLGKEDHYLLVLAADAGESVRPRSDFKKLFAVALAAAFVILVIYFFVARGRQ
jgi:hypothetical protein